MSYGPQPGYPQQPYGPPPGYYGPPAPRPPTNALAYVCALVFLICGVLALVVAIIGWSGPTLDNRDMAAALIGLAFSDDFTGNVDFAVSATMTAACSTLVFAVILFARLDFVRWVLGFVGGLVTVYYVYAIIWLLSHDGGEVIAMVIVSFLLWTAATVLVLLPATGRAMRGYQRKLVGYQPMRPY